MTISEIWKIDDPWFFKDEKNTTITLPYNPAIHDKFFDLLRETFKK